MIDADDIKNKLSKNFSILNIDIDKCHKSLVLQQNPVMHYKKRA